jgi:SAM-dependent methyltransferase
MSQITTGLYRLTQVPQLYALLQNMLGGERTRRLLVDEHIQPRKGDRVLDIGCGSAALLPDLGAVDYTGFDLNPEHIAAARARYGDHARFYCGTMEDVGRDIKGPFDIALAIGVLHHLDDAEVQALCRQVAARLAPGGRFITIDPAFVTGQHWIARWLAARDSGQSVRTPEGYEALMRPAFGTLGVTVRHDLLRVPYTHCIMVASGG